jgi:phosphotransferase system enzyme I (PtsI)
MIKSIIEAAHNAGIRVGMCGEMAGEPAFVLMLLGLGLDEFSMPPLVIPQIKYIIRSITLSQAQEFAREVLKLSTGREVEEFSQVKLKEILKQTAK